MIKLNTLAKRSALSLFAIVCTLSTSAQFLRTSYTQDVPYKMQMNPAMVPTHGYVSPILGPVSVTLQSNAFGSDQVKDMIEAKNNYFQSSDFLNNLESKNNLNMNFGIDPIAFGWYNGKGFWSFNAGIRMEAGLTMPKSVFTMMNEMNGGGFDDNKFWKAAHNWDLAGEKVNIMMYSEVGLGYARKITDKLTVGVKGKFLMGIANMQFEMNTMNVETPAVDIDNINTIVASAENLNWSNYTSYEDVKKANEILEMRKGITGTAKIALNGTMKSSMGGLKWKKDDKGIINNMEMKGFGISGYGLAVDLGATYQVQDNLLVTAAVTDLGFISWNKNNAQKIEVNASQSYDLSYGNGTTDVATLTLANYDKNKEHDLYDFAKKVSSNEIINFDMLQMEETEGEAYTTSLYSTIALGAQYSLLSNKLLVGALYTGHIAKPKTINELTLTGSYNLSSLLNLSLSYSMIQSLGKSFGIGVKVGPVYAGTDYMFLGNNTKCANALVGLSIPLSKGKKWM